jgi:hypothetical protein
MYQLTSSEQKGSDNSEVERSLQNCESSEWKLLRVTLLLRTSRSLTDFGTICRLLNYGTVFRKIVCNNDYYTVSKARMNNV